MNKQGNIENLKPHWNKPGQFPANIPREAVKKKRMTYGSAFKRMSKITADEVFEKLGIPAPKRISGDKKKVRDIIVAGIMAKAMSGNLQAAEMVVERTDGKAVQPVEMLGEGNGNLVDFQDLPLELRVEVLRQMLADAKKELEEQRNQEIKIVSQNEPEVLDAEISGEEFGAEDQGGVICDSGSDVGDGIEAGGFVAICEV